MDNNIDPTKISPEVSAKYQLTANTFIGVAKPDPKDKIDVEIGDSKQPDFKPQVKIMRWDNETNLSFRLKDDGLEKETVTTDKDKIIWSKGTREAHFYDFINAEHPEGASEFEIILKEKPVTNVVEFTLNTKGLDFFYQPELTQEQIDNGMSAPDNVIGSYAVYASEQKTNYVGGKEYKTGKVGHIYRPQVEDAKGTKVWGELNVNTETGILSVTIPQDFLDNAVYPVRHAAGLTFGYTTAGNTLLSAIADATSDRSRMTGNGRTLSTAGTVDSVSAYLAANTSTEVVDIFYGIYREDSGGTGVHALVASGESLNSTITTTKTWKTITFASESLSADDYILGVTGNGEEVAVAYVALYGDTLSTTEKF